MTPIRTHRLAGIDVLRGVAVLLVVLHHIHLRFVLNHYSVADMLPKSVGRVVFWSGYYAVIAFFVISGFLITNLSLKRWGNLPLIDIRQFYLLRAARILPLLFALLAVLSALHLSEVRDYVINPERSSLWRAVIATLTFHLNWLEGARGYLPGSWDVLWSLSVEEAFYLTFPLVCLLIRKDAHIVGLFVALIILGPFYRTTIAGREPWEEYAYFACTDGLAFGCLAALIVNRMTLSRTTLKFALAIGMSLIALVIVFRGTATALNLPSAGLNVSVLELGVALMLLALANSVGDYSLARGTGWLQAIGRCSYEIYLTHMFVVFTGVALFKAQQQTIANAPYWYVAMLIVSVVLGWAVARFYSDPANKALRSRTQPSTGFVGVGNVS